MIDQLKTLLVNNDFLSGGALLMALGTAMALARNIPGRIYRWTKRRLFIDFEITNSDKAFEWIEEWLAKQPYSQNRARWLAVRTLYKDDGKPQIILTPAPGTHWLVWRRRLVVVHRERKEQQSGDSFSSLKEREVFTISIMAVKRQVILDLLKEIHTISEPPEDDRVAIMLPEMYGCDWYESSKRRPRSLDSVILPGGVAEGLVEDLETFLSREKWYNDRGIPWRRGYLIYGPPGSGKSSIVFALASHLHMKLGILRLNESGQSDGSLQSALAKVPPRTIVLIEDIDCVFQKRESSKDKDNRVTFSGLLNAIDGVASSEGTIVFMTTNHLDKLDDALVRPGRCDVKQYIGLPEPDQVKRMFERFFDQPGDVFAGLMDPPPSMATIQGHLIKYSDSWEEALANVGDLISEDVLQESLKDIREGRCRDIQEVIDEVKSAA